MPSSAVARWDCSPNRIATTPLMSLSLSGVELTPPYGRPMHAMARQHAGVELPSTLQPYGDNGHAISAAHVAFIHLALICSTSDWGMTILVKSETFRGRNNEGEGEKAGAAKPKKIARMTVRTPSEILRSGSC
ncbi:hypothetical protein MRB53_037901 [Persea americana]|nr:hypothetical protein MRB53_037901 [Persea americana]